MGPQVRAILFCDKQLLHVYSNKAPSLLIVICYDDTMLIITREVDHKNYPLLSFFHCPLTVSEQAKLAKRKEEFIVPFFRK